MKNQSFFKHFMIIGSGAVINMLIGLLTTPLITRLVNPEEYGQLAIFNTYSNIVMMIFSLGLDQALVRYFYNEENDGYKRKLFFCCWFYPVGIFCIISTVALLVGIKAGFIAPGKETYTAILFILNVIALFLNRFSNLLLRLTKKSSLYSATSILHKVLYVTIALALVIKFKDYHFIMLAIATITSYLATTLVAAIAERKMWNPFKVDYKGKIDYSGMIKYGVPLLVANGIYIIFQAIDKISLSYFCTYSEVGIYASAMSLMSIVAIIRSTFNTIWAPASIEHYEKDPEDRSYYQNMNRYITVVMFAFGLTLILFKDLIAFLLGEKYREASMLMPFLLFQPIMYTVSETTVIGIYFKKKSKSQLIISSSACIFNLVGNFILIPLVGPKGAAISTGLSYILFFTLRTAFSNKYYYVDFGLKKFYMATGMTALYALYSTFVPFDWTNIVFYLVVVVSGCILYRKTLKEMIDIGITKFRSLKKRG